MEDQKFVILGGYIPGKRNYPKNNDMLTNHVICSETFLYNKIYILNYSEILLELNKNLGMIKKEIVTSFDKFYTRTNFKLCLEYKVNAEERNLYNISDYIIVDDIKSSKQISNKQNRIKHINLDKYIV